MSKEVAGSKEEVGSKHPAGGPGSFEIEQTVLFQHCDPAGIVFYPRYFEMINATVEHWFAEALDWSFAQMHLRDGVGVPMASIKTEFHAPSWLGDRLLWRLTPGHPGGSSLELTIRALCDAEQRLVCQATLVFVDMATKRPKRWPDWFRAKLQRPAEPQVPERSK